MNLKDNKGVTLVALTITIIVLLIIASIAIYSGSDTIKNAKLESLKTNMLLIQAKAKEYCEEASFKLGTEENPSNEKISNAKNSLKGTEQNADIPDYITKEEGKKEYIYKLETSNLQEMGINGVESDDKNGRYYVKYNLTDVTVEVYNTKGFTKDSTTYYSLSQLQEL